MIFTDGFVIASPEHRFEIVTKFSFSILTVINLKEV